MHDLLASIACRVRGTSGRIRKQEFVITLKEAAENTYSYTLQHFETFFFVLELLHSLISNLLEIESYHPHKNNYKRKEHKKS